MNRLRRLWAHRMTQTWGWCITAETALVLGLTQIWGGNPFEAFGFTMGMTVAVFLILTGVTKLMTRHRKRRQSGMSDRDGRTGS